MRNLLNATTILLMAAVLPLAAQSTVTGTQTLTSGQHLNLDTGATTLSTGGDLSWSSVQGLNTVGTAVITPFPLNVTSSNFSSITLTQLMGAGYAQGPVFVSAGNVYGVYTNQNNYAAMLVTAVAADSSTITLQFITFHTPTISEVVNNYSQLGPGLPNSGIALGSLFIVKGGSLASATTVSTLESSASPGLPTTLNGATVNVMVNGTTVNPAFYYAIGTQLALVMPSNTPLGSGTLTVNYNGQSSAQFNIQVVATAMGFAGYWGFSNGLGIATNPFTGAFYNYTNSIPPGTQVVLWGSGLGADPTRDTTFVTQPGGFAINALGALYVGGISAPISYQGASGYPGVNQINITIPASAPTGCHVSVVGVTTAGVPTNSITLPIGTGVCEEPEFGRDGNMLSTFAAKTTVTAGSVSLNVPLDASGNFNSPVTSSPDSNQAVGMFPEFYRYTGLGFATAAGVVSSGSCVANPDTYSTVAAALAPGTMTINYDGQNYEYVPTPPAGAQIELLLPGGILFPGGSITLPFQASSQIGAFTVSITLPSPTINWTNQNAAAKITRANGLLITWTGGAAGTYVSISGSASGTGAAGSFNCLAPLSAGQFTVPPYMFAALSGSNVNITVADQTVPQTFNAAILDYGYTQASDSQTVTGTLQ